MHPNNPLKSRVVAALTTVQIIFGINYVVSKVIVEAIHPLVWASFRLWVSTLLMFGLAKLRGKPAPKVNAGFLKSMIFFALLGVCLNQAAFLAGIQHTTATNSAILNTLIPVFTLFLVSVAGIESFTVPRVIGFFSALAGVLILRNIEDFQHTSETRLGDMLTILNCLSFSLFLTFSKKFLQKFDAVWATTWLFLFGSIGLTILAIPDWISFQLPIFSWKLIGCMSFSIIGATIMTYLLNLWALNHTKSSSVALFVYLQPIIASILAWSLLGEQITLRMILSSFLIFLGMVLAIRKSRSSR